MWFILAVVRSLAGTSAVEGYRQARAQRRRGAAMGLVLLATAAAFGSEVFRGGIHAGWWLVAAGAVCLLCAWVVRPRPDPERWLRGAAGEVATAALLDELPLRRWAIRHDLRVPGTRANIDHLVIGPSGVWVVDTKTTRALVRARWRTVSFGDRWLDAGPAKWEAEVVTERLGVAARPLIVVHGDGLRRRGGRSSGVRVVPAAGLLPRLRRGRRRLDRAQVSGIADRADTVFRLAGDGLEKRAPLHG
jgi:hypothetical protein